MGLRNLEVNDLFDTLFGGEFLRFLAVTASRDMGDWARMMVSHHFGEHPTYHLGL